jgi:hypothetical protein
MCQREDFMDRLKANNDMTLTVGDFLVERLSQWGVTPRKN